MNLPFDDVGSTTDVAPFLSAFEYGVDVTTSILEMPGSVNGGPSSSFTATGSVTVTCKYEEFPAVPLPAGLPLALGGLAILGGMGLRRRKRG